MMPLAVGRRLCREFDARKDSRTTALQDADCIVTEGARIAIVGESGSGKSTLLHIMGGIDKPTAGHIEWPALGTVEELRPRKIGIVFQTPSLLPSLTALQNIMLPKLLADAEGYDAMALLEAIDLAAVADKLPQELSMGQAQRVAMARALVLRPPLVLADEPTGFLDGATAQCLIDVVIERVAAYGGTLVLATHDEAVAKRMATRWTMDHGHLDCAEEASERS